VLCVTRWNTKEAAVDTTIRCFSAILSTLALLASDGDDSATRTDQNVDSLWKQIVQQVHTFTTKHSIDTRITERRKTRKLMDGKTARDETRDGEERLRVFMFIPVLDVLCAQMMDRFSDEQCQLL